MVSNHWNTDLHLLPLEPVMQVPRKTKPARFEELVDARAKELMQLAEQANKQCIVLWSGGIDSTCTLAAMIKQGADVAVAMNAHSVYENPEFYRNHIQNRLRIVFVNDVEFREDGEFFFVRTSGCSNLMGGDNNVQYLYNRYEDVRSTTSLELVKDFIRHQGHIVNDAFIELFYKDITTSAEQMGVDISTMWQFVSFYDMIHRISHKFYLQNHPLFFQQSALPDTIKNHTRWGQTFFVTEDFYRWGFYDATLEDRLGKKLTDHKWILKQYIYSVDKNEKYLYKLKTGSYGNYIPLSEHRDYLGLTEDYRFIQWEDTKDYLISANNRQIIGK